MRNSFVDALHELAGKDSRINLVVGDLGFSVVEKFAQDYPAQFLNAGVAEQNMTGVAAGLAITGRIVFTYSIANFPTLRCLEQIRNDVCYHKANVKIVSVGAGVAYGSLGMSHHATEDMAVMRALPEMRVVAPADPVETILAARAIAETEGPFYLRLGKAGEAVIHPGKIDFKLGRAIQLRPGKDAAIIACGSVLQVCVKAAEILAAEGISARVLSMHTIKPIDREAVLSAATETRAIVTVEEHNVVGGLGSAVAEVLSESRAHPPLCRIGVPDIFCRRAGSQAFLREECGITADAIAKAVRDGMAAN